MRVRASLSFGRAQALWAVDRLITGLSFGTTSRADILGCPRKRHPHQAPPGPGQHIALGQTTEPHDPPARAGRKQEQRGLD